MPGLPRTCPHTSVLARTPCPAPSPACLIGWDYSAVPYQLDLSLPGGSHDLGAIDLPGVGRGWNVPCSRGLASEIWV